MDPLKKEATLSQSTSIPKPMTSDQQKIYSDMAGYCQKMQIVDKLCDALAAKDKQQRSQLSQTDIQEAFKSLKITLNSAQMTKIVGPLNPDPLDGSFNYIQMIELMFGR